MMAKGDGLSPLQVRISGHNRSFMLQRLVLNRYHQLTQQFLDFTGFLPQIEADI